MNDINLLPGPIVIVGAGGFIGRAVSRRFAGKGAKVIAVTRRPAELPPAVTQKILGALLQGL